MRLLILGFLLGISPLFADDQILVLSELTSEMKEDFLNGKVLECLEGTVLPFRFSLKGEFLEGENFSTIKVLKTCFIKCVNEVFLFSTDLKDWKEFHKFFNGNLGVSLDAGPEFSLNIELKKA